MQLHRHVEARAGDHRGQVGQHLGRQEAGVDQAKGGAEHFGGDGMAVVEEAQERRCQTGLPETCNRGRGGTASD